MQCASYLKVLMKQVTLFCFFFIIFCKVNIYLFTSLTFTAVQQTIKLKQYLTLRKCVKKQFLSYVTIQLQLYNFFIHTCDLINNCIAVVINMQLIYFKHLLLIYNY